MSWHSIYCTLCGVPLDNVRSAWLDFLDYNEGSKWPPSKGEWRNNLPCFPVPTDSVDEIVTISEQDGASYDDWVCVGDVWTENYVSPPCSYGGYGDISFDGNHPDWLDNAGPLLSVHRDCLSIFCHRLQLSPRELWECFYKPGNQYRRFSCGYPMAGVANMLLLGVVYHDLSERHRQDFGYAISRSTIRDDGESYDRWDDPDSMRDMQWILTRPTLFPAVNHLGRAHPRVVADMPLSVKIFDIPEIFDLILSRMLEISTTRLEHDTHDRVNPPSLLGLTNDILALLQVNSFFHLALLERQGIFLELARQHGWMLPSSPREWHAWRAQGNTFPLNFAATIQPYDWRSYLLACLRKEDPHVRSRWCIHRMCMQFLAGGRLINRLDGSTMAEWQVGTSSYGYRKEVPEAWEWEKVNMDV